MTMKEAIETSIQSLQVYASEYKHWSIAYSGGKDSSATAAFVLWAIDNKLVTAPETLTVMYADTRQELPALSAIARRFMNDINARGFHAQVVLPDMDNRFYVYMLGRGVTPPSNTFRWCTERIKIKPMLHALEALATNGNRFLQITGVRQGESAARDQRIAISCNSKSGECGQGWFQAMSSDAISDTLAPIVHWRQCFVWDWLYWGHKDSYVQKVLGFDARGHGFEYLGDIAAVYGDDDARTGCIGCPLASHDVSLDNNIRVFPELRPLLEIRPLLAELKMGKHRLRKASPELLKSGAYAKKGQRLGPLTMVAREYALHRVLDIQGRAGVSLINAEEEARIRELWTLNTWPQGWEGGTENPNHILGNADFPKIKAINGQLIVEQTIL